MTRLDRLFALTERLRAASPRLVTVAALAAEHQVSDRTIQRDLQTLMAGGVPVRFEEGRGGGWTIDVQHSLPPLNLTESEAVAVMLALTETGRMPYGSAAASALRKVRAGLGAAAKSHVGQWDSQVAVVAKEPVAHDVLQAIESAVTASTALALDYVAGDGATSERVVEPVGMLRGQDHWYLIAWCRTRDGFRAFRTDRIRRATGSDEPVARRDLPTVLRDEGVQIR
ncbi:putative DNA-binding transcriptional regulator YafY [Branchiibius hedensis]|uniref:HTH domain-containing protein n=1 Tax=Branchiibius hedensis TaxID=672460 RepID=A0A2Y8ZT57_9MICO|nr:YafY family protein [Branchiibius hedensis]PWJ24280.1 putative DNA-binding transcriptional regulator YafY [Branchiibius hedensis]SSA33097.1 HTH domain-containing protein [Branchiibius hedensis]